jgi:pyruvate dehydrogenase E2 component (dihydrolipoamide acetyltransferase)
MALIFRMPRLGDMMTEGKISIWSKGEGEEIKKGEFVVTIETDKVSYELESPESGILSKIFAVEGTIVPVNGPMAIITQVGETVLGAMILQAQREMTGEFPKEEEGIHLGTPSITKEIKATPLAKKIAKDHGVLLEEVKPQGEDGRIAKEDVERYLQEREERLEKVKVGAKPEKSVPLTSMRKIIARRLTESYQQTPHVYLSSEVDMTEAINILKRLNEYCESRISVNDLLIKVSAIGLAEFSDLNTSLRKEEIIFHSEINIGLAVSVEAGLLVPVIRNPLRLSLIEIASERQRLVELARENKLKLSDLENGTFTISNLGAYGIESFTSIINPPQCAILSVGETKKKPVINGERVEISSVMKITLSIDHRIVDGVYGAKFLQYLRDRIEKPYLLL